MEFKEVIKKLTPEQYKELGEKAKLLKTAEEIIKLFKEYDIEISDSKAKSMLIKSCNKSLNDDDLENVTGGISLGDPCGRIDCPNNEDGCCDCHWPCWFCGLTPPGE